MDLLTRRAAQRLLRRLVPADFELLRLLIEADLRGRPPLPYTEPQVVQKMRSLLPQLDQPR